MRLSDFVFPVYFNILLSGLHQMLWATTTLRNASRFLHLNIDPLSWSGAVQSSPSHIVCCKACVALSKSRPALN